jgi:hypothetical protein
MARCGARRALRAALRAALWLALWLALAVPARALGMCSDYQKQVQGVLVTCSGHGSCSSLSKRCFCEEGYGSDAELAVLKLVPPYPKPDCSERLCGQGKAWNDVPVSADQAHSLVECSGVGSCNRATGVCNCGKGYDGAYCQFWSCKPDSTKEESAICSGHGQCFTLAEIAQQPAAQPINRVTYYGGFGSTTTWDQDMITSCLCDSSWDVGLGAGQRQLPEYFGPYCERRRCPSGNDPMTTANELNCEGKLQDPITGAVRTEGGGLGGSAGNLCHIDCSNRGICDYSSGICKCFSGYAGEACETQNVLALG